MRAASSALAIMLLEDHLEAEAIRIILPDSSEIRYTNWTSEYSIDGLAYAPAADLQSTDPTSPQDSSMEQVLIKVPDPDGKLAKLYVNKQIVGLKVYLWLVCANQTLTAVENLPAYLGAIEEVKEVGPGFIVLAVGPDIQTYGKLIPPPFSEHCQFHKTSQCPYTATCAKTFAACTANGKTGIFLGQTHLVPAGFKLEFQDSTQTIIVDGG